MVLCNSCGEELIPRHPVEYEENVKRSRKGSHWEGNWLPKEYREKIFLCGFCISRTTSFLNQTREDIWYEQDSKCNKCEHYVSYSKSELDHIVERAVGGTNQRENLQVLCYECHLQKTIEFNAMRAKQLSNERKKKEIREMNNLGIVW